MHRFNQAQSTFIWKQVCLEPTSMKSVGLTSVLICIGIGSTSAGFSHKSPSPTSINGQMSCDSGGCLKPLSKVHFHADVRVLFLQILIQECLFLLCRSASEEAEKQ